MNFIKVKNKENKTVILNVDEITAFYERDGATTISMTNPDDILTINQPIEAFEKYLSSCDNVSLHVI